MLNKYTPFLLIVILVTLFSCGDDQSKPTSQQPVKKTRPEIKLPEFNADSAYQYVQDQVDFGPRVPNTAEHAACATYLGEKMKELGATVLVQKAKVEAYDGTILNIKNIIASYQPEKNNRIMLFAHWDSRPFADHCEDVTRRDQPILGANDGASGIGVLMEIGRILKDHPIKMGVDIIFFDAEDYGTPDHKDLPYAPDTWCLGSQYWSHNMHVLGYYPRYGILLDMVGAKGATFYKEQVSLKYAPDVVQKVWGMASKLGYSSYFVSQQGGQVIDDHLYVNQIAHIPSIDIIQHDPTTFSNFGMYWHTHNDNMDVIDRNTLKAVGQTLIGVLVYEE
ncbi:MAG: M28 family peptidase [Bacteroidales bacterium]|nr:M28 family peptidase [Bacteroidales bacterium]MCF8458529.1 M28 family peptidase [Bacteroidales bacterium]